MTASDILEHQRARWALEQWAKFPIRETPRPLVFVGPLVLVHLGFRSGSAKLGFLRGAIDGDSSVPTQVLDLLRTEGSLHAVGDNETRVLVRDARREMAEFRTDRGLLPLAAWHLESDDVTESIIVLDPGDAHRRWKPPASPDVPRPYPGPPHRAHGATLGSDGSSLTLNFVGGAVSDVDYPSAAVFESDTAVAIVPTRADRDSLGRRTAVSAVGVPRSVAVELAAPLGSRVLIDLDGSPVVVTPSEP